MAGANILGLVGTPDPAAFLGNHQAQVHSESAVGGPRVWPHMSSWVHDGVFDLCRKYNTLFFHLSSGGGIAKLKWQYKITVNLDWAFVRLRINILLSFLCEGIKIKYSLFARSYIYTEHFHPQFWHQPHEIVSKRGIRWAKGHKHLFVIIHIPLLPVSSCVLPSTENTLGTCPLRHPVVSGNLSSKEQVLGAPLQAFSFFLPRTINDKSIVRNESQYNSDSSCLDPHVIYNVILTVVMRRLHTHTETMCFAPLDTDLQSKD